MRYYWVALIVLFLFAPFQVVYGEEIQYFTSSININQDGTFKVTEDIKYDFGDEQRHGIFRYIPTTHPQAPSVWYKTRFVDVSDVSVQLDGNSVPFTVDSVRSEFFIKIGDPDNTVSGVHTYKISYEIAGGLFYGANDQVELYWNVTGNDWLVPINKVSAVVTAPDGAFVAQSYCYQGMVGSTESCQAIITASNEATFKSSSLRPGENLTVAQELDGIKIATLILERIPTWFIWFTLIPVWLVGAVVFVYRYRTRFRLSVPIIVQYEPYKDFKPMFSGVLIDGKLNPRDITAGLVYLAEQGFLMIEKTSRKVFLLMEVNDYDIILKRPVEEVETNFLKTVLKFLFNEDEVIGARVALSKLKTDSAKQQTNYKSVEALRKAIKKDLVERGYFERFSNLPLRIVSAAAVVILIMVSSAVFVDVSQVLPPIIFALVCTVVIFSFMYQRRTRKGYEAFNHLKGFKQFLSVTDKDRFTFHNAPKKSPTQFMEYLPYAIAFGVEKEWAEVFKDITLPDPSWYHSDTGHNTFSAVAFTNDLSVFSSAFASSSGSSSASSGGGSSGGGAGGGGGGSW